MIDETQFYARIKKIEFLNFRNIASGSIEFPNSKVGDFLDGAPSIIGLYGQNGSGKSSVIMALGILKDVLSGQPLNNKYASSIRYGCESCGLKFSFAMYAKIFDENGKALFDPELSTCYDVEYSFDIQRRKEEYADLNDEESTDERLIIMNEVFKYRMTDKTGKVGIPKQVFFDTRSVKGKKSPFFGSVQKEMIFSGFDDEVLQKYKEIFAVTQSKSQSFVFSLGTINLLAKNINRIFEDDEIKELVNEKIANLNNSETSSEFQLNLEDSLKDDKFREVYIYANYIGILFNLVKNLRLFGRSYLHVIDTVTTGITNINTQLPLLLWSNIQGVGINNYRISLKMDGPTHVTEKSFKYVKHSLNAVSDVLEKIVPGVRLNIVDYGKQLNNENAEEHYFEITSNRDNVTLPLKYESDGIRRIVSILSLLIAAYNDESFTIAIDEIDSGIFEYLLGELLSVMVDSIKGQLIFTSHNLRPLEVLPSKYLCFTTTNPENRFSKITNRGNSNLRDTYFRTIVLNTGKEPVYNKTDKYEIELAFYKAGHAEVESDE